MLRPVRRLEMRVATGSADVLYMMEDTLEIGSVRVECLMVASWELGL